MTDPRRHLPSVHAILEAMDVASTPLLAHLIGDVLAEERRRLAGGGEAVPPSLEDVVTKVRERLAGERPGLAAVLNLTGVVLHTNLGRAPLAPLAVEAVREAAQGYTDLEMDLASGRRSSRLDHVDLYLRLLTGAEAHLVVNNNAAGVFLALLALAGGREVLISRGELVEIGGSFRIPDIMNTSGARLVEVGTTNRTRLDDYARAITPGTAALMKVHPSNFRQVGFVEETPLEDLASLARERGVMLLDDLGSGSLLPVPGGEPTVSERLASGSDLVFFSGDKLMGGPQAGIVAGRKALVDQMKRHPLYRALRPDKMTLAALRATLYLTLVDPEGLPVRSMILARPDLLERRADRLCSLLRQGGVQGSVSPRQGASGGGSLPEVPLDGWAVRLDPGAMGAGRLQESLRIGRPPLLAVVERDEIVLDVRTLPDDQVDDAAAAILRAYGRKAV